ncbi:AEC family transporter [Aliiruegeria sabulilitoris]|uniref:AEC family transporter n=1 Tax=Aliiruegeria sabulilitoris TaxID=1510458 RepID=UPI000829A2DE|nr:AEC family transporter [Aliiruegeria sabulilitoris]NDR57593.1 malonate transporter [Pseudoruegeria sp. M32A2M]
MLHVLTHQILPVFSMLALGFLLGRFGKVSRAEAAAINRVGFLVLQPALLFPLVSGLDLSAFHFDAMAIYIGCQVVVFALSFAVARYLLRRTAIEAWLLAMATVFVNSVLYILPIAQLMHGGEAGMPIRAVVAWDSAVSFPFFIITTDLLANRGAALGQTLKRLGGNPVLLAVLLALVFNFAGLTAPAPVLTAMNFAGVAAAPMTLFALGVILSGQNLVPTPTVVSISTLKLIAFPALAWAALHLGERPEEWNTLLLLCAAGPSGAMAFSLALLHGVRTDQIAPVIIWTSVLSLISLAWLA